MYTFLGDHGTCLRFKGPNPVVEPAPNTSFEIIEPDPTILAMQQELNVDFGQFDYVMHDGRAVLLDVNRTIGRGSMVPSVELDAQRVHRARGLYKYFRD
jgi:hypothetical protein